MKLKDIYKIIVEEGMKHDPRGEDVVQRLLKEQNDRYEKLDKDEREEFDLAALSNPYADTRLLYGDENKEIKRALVGVDLEVGELLLADRINSRDKENKIGLCIAHHPEGKAWANFYEVMSMQAGILSKFGIPINVGEDLLNGRMKEVERRVHSSNHNRSVDAARLLDIPLLCMHTPADNFVAGFIQDLMDKRKPQRVKEVVAILKEIPEYQLGLKDNAGPRIFMGDEERSCGKVLVEMTGGTEGPKEIFDSYVTAGIGTIICMHLSEEHFKAAKGKHINVIVAGHISSDNVGLNLLLDKIQAKSNIEIVECSGFRRVKR